MNVQLVLAFMLFVGTFYSLPLRADIFRGDNGEPIPGTEGIELKPGVRLDHRNLEFTS